MKISKFLKLIFLSVVNYVLIRPFGTDRKRDRERESQEGEKDKAGREIIDELMDIDNMGR